MLKNPGLKIVEMPSDPLKQARLAKDLLWTKIVHKQMGVRFHRDFSLRGGVVIDFWSRTALMAISVGPLSKTQIAILKKMGAIKLVLDKDQITGDVGKAVESIRAALAKGVTTHADVKADYKRAYDWLLEIDRYGHRLSRGDLWFVGMVKSRVMRGHRLTLQHVLYLKRLFFTKTF